MQSRTRTHALRITLASSIAAASTIALAGSASAHMGVDLRGATQTAGKSSVIFLRPGHGCDGDATNAIVVTIPSGVTGAKAQQKAGWTTSATSDTVTWSGGALPDDEFDDFGLRLTWPKLPAGVGSQPFYFKAVQTCNAEITVRKAGGAATITGALPGYAGKPITLFVDSIPLTRHPVVPDAQGRFQLQTSAAKVPDGSDVIARFNGRQIGNSVPGMHAWTEIPIAGSSATLASPAPSVTVTA